MSDLPYSIFSLEDDPTKFSFTCGNSQCKMPHLIIGPKPYVEEKAIAHTQWCVIEKRQPPMAWR